MFMVRTKRISVYLIYFLILLNLFQINSILHNDLNEEPAAAATKATTAKSSTTTITISVDDSSSKHQNLDLKGDTSENGAGEIGTQTVPTGSIATTLNSATIRINVDVEDAVIKINDETATEKKSTATTTASSVVSENTKVPVSQQQQIKAPPVVENEDTSTTTTTTTTTVEPPTTTTERPPIESFEEWKEMKLKEERRAVNEEAPVVVQVKTNTNTKSPTTTTTVTDDKKDQNIIMKKNFASIECGAKILAANAESSKPSHILTESRDDYMLNSCSNKIWFVVELCEPIKIQEFEIANFELFSNTPKQFSVYASERYPNKNWTKNFIGTYDAAPVRTVQLFNIQQQKSQNNSNTGGGSAAATDSEPYVKYIKFEMLSHYGNEHYCPLSLVRIYGTSMDDDVVQTIDDSNSNSGVEAAIISQNLTNEQPESVRATTTTTSTPTTTVTPPIVETVTEASVQTSTTATTITNTTTSEPASETTTTTVKQNANNSNNDGIINIAYKAIKNTIIPTTSDQDQKLSFFKKFIDNITSYFIGTSNRQFSHQQKQHTIANSKNSNGKSIPENEIINNGILHTMFKTILCSYSKVNINCCQCTMNAAGGSVSGKDEANKYMRYCPYYFIILTKCTSKLFAMRYDKIIKQFNSQMTNNQTNYTKITVNDINYLISNDLFYTLNDDFTSSAATTTSTSAATNDEIVQDNSLVLDGDLDMTTTAASATISSSETTNDSILNDIIGATTDPFIGASATSSDNYEETGATSDETLVNNTAKQVTVPQTTTTTTVPVSVSPPQQQQQQQVTPPTKNIQINNLNSGKDVILMRLNNRIKALELNMSLSSQYLEQLSQHYRKQIDEMQKLFNKTTNALINTATMADERDSKQSDRIRVLEKRLETMQNTINLFYFYMSNISTTPKLSKDYGDGVGSSRSSSSSSSSSGNLVTSTPEPDRLEGDEKLNSDSTSAAAAAHNRLTTSLNFYIKRLNFEANYLSFLNYKFEFLLLIVILLIFLNSCILCIIVLILRQRYLVMKLNLYENNKIYLKNIVDEQVNRYLNEMKLDEQQPTSKNDNNEEDGGGGGDRNIIENLSATTTTTVNSSNNRESDYLNHHQQQQQQQQQAAAAVCVIAASTVAAVAFAATNVVYNNNNNDQQQSSSPSIQTASVTT